MNVPQILKEDFSNLRRTGAALYQMRPCTWWKAMGYIYRTESGRIFCIDGGNKEETDLFLRLLRAVSGTPEGQPCPIDGWFLTHPHEDHLGVFFDTVEKHADEVEITSVYHHLPPTSYIEKYEPQNAGTMREYDCLRPLFAHREVILTEGDRLDFGEVSFDILSEPDTSITADACNASTVAIRMTAAEQTVLFLADMSAEAGDVLLQKYGDSLRADLCQVAHHGSGGAKMDVYRAVSPKACLWCTPDWLWTNDGGKGYGTGSHATFTTRCFLYDLGVRHHYVQKDGIWEIPLPWSEM